MKPPDLDYRGPDPKQLLLRALEMRWNNYRNELQNCRAEFTNEAVHDLRVATRRILALIQLLNSISPAKRFKKMARSFKEQLDEFDDLRDTQVILEELNEILPELPQLQKFQEHLLSTEDELFQVLHKRLKKLETSEIVTGIHKTSDSIEAETNDGLESRILDSVDDAFLVARQRLEWVDLARPATIHRVRVAFKAFRYMVEIVHPFLSEFPLENLKRMNEYQTLMGNIQDAEVFTQTFADFLGDAHFPGIDLVHSYCKNRGTKAICAYADSMERLHAFWRAVPDQPFPWEKVQ